MSGFGAVHHGKKHNIGDAKNHEGNIYDALVGALHALTAANVAVDAQTLHDAISAAIVGMDWQSTVIRFEAMVTNVPVAPSNGDRYISTEAGTIPSTTQAVLVDDVCEWDSATSLWIVTTPDDGWAVQETQPDPNIAWWYSGSAWRKIGTMVDHSNLLNLNWSVAGHVMNTALDMNSNQINEVTDPTLAQDAATKNYVDSSIAFSKQFPIYHVSDSKGSDTNDGGDKTPLKTVQKAFDLGDAAGHDPIGIKIDSEGGASYSGIAPAGKNSFIFSFEPISWGGGGDLALTLGNGCEVRLQNISCSIIKEGSGFTSGTLVVEDSVIQAIKNNTETAPASNLDVVISNAFLEGDAVTDVDGVNSIFGNAFDVDNTKFFMFEDQDMKTKKIYNLADPSAAQDADTKNARDAAITTHTGLPNAHHAQLHAASHKDGGGDELDVSELAGALGATGEVPETDGAAVTWVEPDGRYDPKAHKTTHENGGSDEIDVTGLEGARDISCSVLNTGNQSFPNNTWQFMTWDYEEYDTDAMHDISIGTQKIFIPTGEGGKYLIVAGITFAGNSAGVRGIKVRKNASTDVIGATLNNPIGTNETAIFCMRVVELSAGDYIELFGYQTSGGALNAVALKCNFQAVKQRG